MLRRSDSCLAVASATSHARGGAPFCCATWMIVAAFCRCSALNVAAVSPVPDRLADRSPASHTPGPANPPPVPPW